MIYLIIAIALGLILIERLFPANELPQVKNWWGRILLCNSVQLLIIIVAGISWDRWLREYSLFHASEYLGEVPAAIVAYIFSTAENISLLRTLRI
jgi:hypothetical protein